MIILYILYIYFTMYECIYLIKNLWVFSIYSILLNNNNNNIIIIIIYLLFITINRSIIINSRIINNMINTFFFFFLLFIGINIKRRGVKKKSIYKENKKDELNYIINILLIHNYIHN